jgi:hypothetical protein
MAVRIRPYRPSDEEAWLRCRIKRRQVASCGLSLASAAGHYLGEDRDEIRRRFARVHDCALYEHRFGAT